MLNLLGNTITDLKVMQYKELVLHSLELYHDDVSFDSYNGFNGQDTQPVNGVTPTTPTQFFPLQH